METAILQDYERQRLLEYADSFRELADSFQHFGTGVIPEKKKEPPADEEALPEEATEELTGREAPPVGAERQMILWERQLSEQRGIFAGQLAFCRVW